MARNLLSKVLSALQSECSKCRTITIIIIFKKILISGTKILHTSNHVLAGAICVGDLSLSVDFPTFGTGSI
jgi:hypothetical protein